MSLSSGVHGVIVVHGIGDTVAEFSKALCDTLINSPKGDSTPTTIVAARVQKALRFGRLSKIVVFLVIIAVIVLIYLKLTGVV